MNYFLLFLAFVYSLSCQAQVPLVTTTDTTTIASGPVRLPNLTVQAHQQVTSVSSKGVKLGTGLAIEPGRQVAIFYANPDTTKSHLVKIISVLIDRKFSYGRLRVNLRQCYQGAPATTDELPVSYYILPESIARHHTILSFSVPEGFIMPKNGLFIYLEGLTSTADEKFMRVVATPIKKPAADGSSKVELAVKTLDATGQEHLTSLDDYPKLVASPLRLGVNSSTWVKIAADSRYPFRRNVPTGLGSRTPVAYNVVTQLTFLSW